MSTTEDRVLDLLLEIGDADLPPEAIASYLLAEDLADENLPDEIERAVIDYAGAARRVISGVRV